jgi:hypothetical protein
MKMRIFFAGNRTPQIQCPINAGRVITSLDALKACVEQFAELTA